MWQEAEESSQTAKAEFLTRAESLTLLLNQQFGIHKLPYAAEVSQLEKFVFCVLIVTSNRQACRYTGERIVFDNFTRKLVVENLFHCWN